MKKQNSIFVLFFIFVFFSVIGISAQQTDCDQVVTSTNTDELFNEFDSINSKLTACDAVVPKSLGFLIRTGNILVEVHMNDGTIENFYLKFTGKKLKSVNSGIPDKSLYAASLSEDTLNKILSADNKGLEAISQYYDGNIKVKGNTLWSKVKLFFSKFFVPGPGASGGAGGGA